MQIQVVVLMCYKNLIVFQHMFISHYSGHLCKPGQISDAMLHETKCDHLGVTGSIVF